jgi:REP element-mobilizing transposase RayT
LIEQSFPSGRNAALGRPTRRSMRRRGKVQLELPAPARWGGARKGAGRKLVAARPSPPHRPRAPHDGRWPVHVTLRARPAIASLRSARVFPILRQSLAASHKAAFRVVHFSVQSDHVHIVVEGDAALALVRGVQGLAGRCAKAINRAVGRRGRVWSSRHHAHALRTPIETRRGLVYVLLNFRKHLRASPGVDPRSSGPWFGGWRRSVPAPREDSPVASPRTWLASVGWHRAGGAIGIDERPGARRASPRPTPAAGARVGHAFGSTEPRPNAAERPLASPRRRRRRRNR